MTFRNPNVPADPDDNEPVTGELIPAIGKWLPERLPARVVAMFEDIRSRINDDPEQATIDILDRILSAHTLAELSGVSRVVHGKAYVNVPFIVNGFKWQPGQYDDGLPFYAVMDAIDCKTGEHFALTCGGTNVIGSLYVLERDQLMPCAMVIHAAAKPSQRGYTPLWLEPAELDAEGKPF